MVTLEEAKDAPHLLAAAGTEGRLLIDREGRWVKLRAEAEMQVRRDHEQHKRRIEKALAGIDRMLAD